MTRGFSRSSALYLTASFFNQARHSGFCKMKSSLKNNFEPSPLDRLLNAVKDKQGSIFLLDGGTGEELFRRGVPDDRKIWSATAVVKDEYHDVLKEVHRSFLEAGADAITTNSYGIVPGVGFDEEDIVRFCGMAGKLARKVASEDSSKLVFGSLGPLVESYRPDLIMEHEKGVGVYRRMARALEPHIDAFLAETMSSVEESMQVIEGVSALNAAPACLVSYTLASNGCFRSGEKATSALPRLLDFSAQRGVRVCAILFNCSEPEAITVALMQMQNDETLQRLLHDHGILLGAYANRLTPVSPDWSLETSEGPQPMRSDMDPQTYNTVAHKWVDDLGVKIIGGCCGITPDHIKVLHDNFDRAQTS